MQEFLKSNTRFFLSAYMEHCMRFRLPNEAVKFQMWTVHLARVPERQHLFHRALLL